MTTTPGEPPTDPTPFAYGRRRDDLVLVLGERRLHEFDLYNGVLLVGQPGSGRGSAATLPLARQVLSHKASDPRAVIGGIGLGLRDHVRYELGARMREARPASYVELGQTPGWCWNPLENDLDVYGTADTISCALGWAPRVAGPFWHFASTNFLKFVILLHRALVGYVTLYDVYQCASDHSVVEGRLATALRRLDVGQIRNAATCEQLVAIKRWFENAWTAMRLDQRTTILDGIAGGLAPGVFVTLNVVDEFAVEQNLEDCAVHVSIAFDRVLAALLKTDFQRAILRRLDAGEGFRRSMFLCNDYELFATAGGRDRLGDDAFFERCREARCIFIAAIASDVALKSTVIGSGADGLLSSFRSRVVLKAPSSTAVPTAGISETKE